jgi:hypothetical protein
VDAARREAAILAAVDELAGAAGIAPARAVRERLKLNGVKFKNITDDLCVRGLLQRKPVVVKTGTGHKTETEVDGLRRPD